MQEKPSYKIGQVSKITGLQAYVLRFWESEFPSLHPPKSKGNQRVYTEADLAMVHRIKALLYEEGLTISGARKKLSEKKKRRPKSFTEPHERHLIQRVKQELEALLCILK
jgi:DNA-binding transcriptional MerR regulator